MSAVNAISAVHEPSGLRVQRVASMSVIETEGGGLGVGEGVAVGVALGVGSGAGVLVGGGWVGSAVEVGGGSLVGAGVAVAGCASVGAIVGVFGVCSQARTNKASARAATTTDAVTCLMPKVMA